MLQFLSPPNPGSSARLVALVASCLLFACSSQTRSPLTGPPDSGRDASRTDSGPQTDSGQRADSGRQDSGTAMDARTPPVDSGPRVVDREWFSSPRSSAAIFATGHSLIDRVFGRPLENGGPMAALAQAAGKTHTSLLQDGAGSSTALRRQDIEDGSYPTPPWGTFDTLIVTERVDIAGTIRHERSIENIGWFVDNIRNAGSSPDEFFFYETWWELNGPSTNGQRLTTPQIWSAYVHDELRLYECVAERVATQRGIRIRIVPGALALSDLLLTIVEGRAPGLSQSDIFEDAIHMTDLGDTFMAMVFLATVYRTPTEGLTVPGIPASTATLFASIADRVVGNYFANFTTPTPTQCRAVLQDFCLRFGDECNDTANDTFPNSAW